MIVLAILLVISGIGEVYWRKDMFKGLMTLGLAFAIPFGLYRSYFTGVLGFIFGLILLFALLFPSKLGAILFIAGFAYIFVKEWKRRGKTS
ncbi:MAG: hypothetical protein H0Z28_02375 [Archaeoglobus sp.]|nr:hypothetical protein [Archaeoglobus sp.]